MVILVKLGCQSTKLFREKVGHNGVTRLDVILRKRGLMIGSYFSTLVTFLLMFRRIDRHPSWNVFESRKIAQSCIQFSVHEIVS